MLNVEWGSMIWWALDVWAIFDTSKFKPCIKQSLVLVFYAFETSSPHGRSFCQLKGPCTIFMQTFCNFNKKHLVLVGEGLLPWASPNLQACLFLWATTLEVTTLKLEEALGSRSSPIHRK
jgi:hypothetical protein